MKMTNWWELDVWKAVNKLEPTVKTELIVSECYQTPDGRKSTGIWAVTKDWERRKREERASEQRRRLKLRIVVQPQASTISWLCLLFFNLLLCQLALIWHLFFSSLLLVLPSSIGFFFVGAGLSHHHPVKQSEVWVLTKRHSQPMHEKEGNLNYCLQV